MPRRCQVPKTPSPSRLQVERNQSRQAAALGFRKQMVFNKFEGTTAENPAVRLKQIFASHLYRGHFPDGTFDQNRRIHI